MSLSPATMAGALLTSARLPDAVAATLEATADHRGLLTKGRLPAHWTDSQFGDAVAAAPADVATKLAGRVRTHGQVEAVLDRERRITVLRALAVRELPADAYTLVVVRLVREDGFAKTDLFGDHRRHIDPVVAARHVLADPAVAGLAAWCPGEVVEVSLDTDPSGTSLAAFCRQADPGTAQAVGGAAVAALARGLLLDVDDGVLLEVTGEVHAAVLRDAARALYRHARLPTRDVEDLLDRAGSLELFDAWVCGQTANDPSPGQIAQVATTTARQHLLSRIVDREQGRDDLSHLPWYPEIVGSQRVSGRTLGSGAPDAMVARIAEHLGDDPVAWQTFCELAGDMASHTIDHVCRAARAVAAA